MKNIKMNTALDIFQALKAEDEKGGYFLKWEKKGTIYADVRPDRGGHVATILKNPDIEIGQKVCWKNFGKEFCFYVDSMKFISGYGHTQNVFLKKDRCGVSK